MKLGAAETVYSGLGFDLEEAFRSLEEETLALVLALTMEAFGVFGPLEGIGELHLLEVYLACLEVDQSWMIEEENLGDTVQVAPGQGVVGKVG